MDIVSTGRAVLRVQYHLASWPLRVAERRVVAGLLGQDSAARRAAERLLASLDDTAASVLGDESLRAEATRLRRHSEALDQAVSLEREADRLQRAADQQLSERSRQADEQRARASQDRRERVSDAQQERQAGRKKVAERAAEHAAQDKDRADERARDRAEAATGVQREREKRTRARTEQVVEPAKEELEEAARDKAEAREDGRDAEGLGELADHERAERKTGANR